MMLDKKTSRKEFVHISTRDFSSWPKSTFPSLSFVHPGSQKGLQFFVFCTRLWQFGRPLSQPDGGGNQARHYGDGNRSIHNSS
jgi:hypothetical protein